MSQTPKSKLNLQSKPKYVNGINKPDQIQNKISRGTSADRNQRKNEVEQKTNSSIGAAKTSFDFSPISQRTQQDQVRQKEIEHASPQSTLRNFRNRSVSTATDFKSFQQRNQNQNQLVKEQTLTKNTQAIKMNTQRFSFKPTETTQKQKLVQVQPKKNQKTQVQQQKVEQKSQPLKLLDKKKDVQNAVSPISKTEDVKNQKKQQDNATKSLTPRLDISKVSNTPPQKLITTQRGKSPSHDQNYQSQKLKAFISVIRPIFKDAKYYITSVIHFLREQHFPNTTPYKVQFQIEFQEQQLYFRQKFCDHYLSSFQYLKQCQTLQQKTTIKPIQMDPPKQPKLSKNSPKTIIFDLDETLIHCNDINLNPTDHEITVQIPNEPPQQVRFNIRPYCIEMLSILSQFYELILFTASFQQYADQILEFIDPKKQIFSYRLYRDSCITLGDGLLVKDLRVLEGRNLESMALVDNSAYCYFLQPDNGIPIIPFEDNKKDKELIFLTDYLIKCEKHPNWLEHHKHHFKNFIHFKAQTITECLRRII
ncbi:unnamed protein product [Paramecium octaurelia]|uniref:FCP1 homology domain-containing protein n=1 Tax=Paramecium octaurelia TaxID=43137 RepID=A0A8S1SPB2_PAROT|nr:unnamed protein product [Paramecium octaurelia]